MEPLTYKSAGVDTDRAHAMVGDLADICRRTHTLRAPHQAFGLFAAALDLSDFTHPVLLAACDGVGTKLLLQLEHDELEGAGVDLVAMNVNDILTSAAQPLMFLDYIGIHQLDEARITRLVTGMADALTACDCILAGGETAEMPDMVAAGSVELSGFCVGAAEKDELLDPSTITTGDVVIGVPSSGFHSNGWSLIRKVIAAHPEEFDAETARALLTPTRIYYPEVQSLKKAGLRVRGMAHITGGGIRENLGRILGAHGADLQLPRWANASAAKVLKHIDIEEGIHTLNMGIGWIVVAAPDQADQVLASLPDAVLLGTVGGAEINVGTDSWA